MKKIHNKWLKGGLFGVLALLGMASCSDDHFDLNTTNASGTLWQNLVATNQVDSFTMILEKTIVNKKTYGIPATISYKDLLNSQRVLTVWAPKDGTYNAKKWLNMLENGQNEDVEKQFVRNHIANFNYNGANQTVEKLLLQNSKYAVYDVTKNTFLGAAISNDPSLKNIASVNGTVHILEQDVPYAPSIREIINSTANLDSLYQYILDKDTLAFIESLSKPGSTVDGKIQYVDSFFVESNKILPSIAMNEDSLSAAILPSNQAWIEACERISKFYNYKDRYAYFDSDLNKWFVDSLKADSMKKVRTMNVIFNNMFYSLREQRGFDYENATAESVGNFFSTADSLVSTAYYYQTYKGHQHAPQCRELTEGKTPIEGSNGYAFITDHFNFIANKAWAYDIKLEGENTHYFNTDKSKYISTASPRGIRHYVTETNVNDSVIGHPSDYCYIEIQATSKTVKPVIAYNLPDILSGTYDIYVVIVPENMVDKTNTEPKANQFTAKLEYDIDETGKAASITAPETFKSDPSKVDTILLFKDFKFPYCYYGLSRSYPCISLTTVMSISDRKTVTPYYNIDCFILKSKDE